MKDGNSVARSRYLETAYDLIRSELLPEAPERKRVALAFSFPVRGARSAKVIGECHHLTPSEKKRARGEGHLIVIHPTVWRDDLEVLATLAHEMAHAALPKKTGHRRPFAELVTRIGLDGKPTATVPGESFKRWVKGTRKRLPDFPGGVSFVPQVKKQTTRLRLWQCECEKPIKVRVASDEFSAMCHECGEDFAMQETG